MNFDLTPNQAAVREFASEKLKPGAGTRDQSGEFLADLLAKVARFGLMGLFFPEEYGGGGKDFLSYTIAVEELARADASVAITLLSHTL